MTAQTTKSIRETALRWGLYAFLVIAAYFLWTEHRAHVAGALPYVLLLACPVIHLLMHRRRRGHHEVSPPEHPEGG